MRYLREARVPLGERCRSVLFNLYHGVIGASRKKQIAAVLFQCRGSDGLMRGIFRATVVVSRYGVQRDKPNHRHHGYRISGSLPTWTLMRLAVSLEIVEWA
jgi:hypothetical protein